MRRPDTILVATDLSDNAEAAIHRAALLARQSNARLELLHVVDERPPGEPDAAYAGASTEPPRLRWLEHARERLRQQARRVLGDETGASLAVEAGKDFVTIIQRARQIDARLIVVGAQGSDFAAGLLLGTTAEKVVRKGDRPVLVVRTRPAGPYERVLAATDFSAASQEAVAAALPLAPDARLELLHVYRLWGAGRMGGTSWSDRDVQRNLGRLLEAASHQMDAFTRRLDLGTRIVQRHLRHGHPGSVIPAVATELNADLVAIGTEGLSGLPYILLGSVAEHVMRHTDRDVLAVRPSTFDFRMP